MGRRKTRSKKRMKKIADAGSKGNRLQYRCTLQGMQILYKDVKIKLKKGHHDAIEKTPFKHIFKALHNDGIVKEKKKDEMLDNFILSYDRKTKKFKFGSEFYKPTRLDVKLIFGIEDGTKDVGKITDHGRGESKLVARHFANVKRLTTKKVKDKVKELVDNEDQESIDDTVKLLCAILMHTVLFPNTGAYIAWGFLYYVDDFDRLNSYDWSQHVLDELMNGLHDDWSNPKQVNGCTLLLLYWFCEHSDKIQDVYKNDKEKEPIQKGVQGISSKGIPRITKWRLKKLEKLVGKSVLHEKDKKLFNNNELMPTIAEEYLIRSLNEKRKAKKIVIQHDLDFEQSVADDETLVDLMREKYKRVKIVKKKKEVSSGDSAEEGPGVESGYSSEGNQDSEATQVEKDIENVEELGDNSEGKSNAEAKKAYDEAMKLGFDTFDIPMSENVEEPHDSLKGKSIAEAKKVYDCGFDMSDRLTVSLLSQTPMEVENTEADQDEPKKKKELGKTVTLLGKRKKRMTEKNIKEKKGLNKDDKMKKLEEENSRLKGIVDSLKREQVNLIGKQESMAVEHNEMQIALDEEVAKKTELLCELGNVKLAREKLLNELALAKFKIEQLEDKAKENESMVQNLPTYTQNLVHDCGSQNSGQESIQQQEVDKKMIESLRETVARLEKEMYEKDTTINKLKAMTQDQVGTM